MSYVNEHISATVMRLSKDNSPHVTNELFNTISHLAAACVALLGAVLLIAQASVQGDPWKIAGFSIYGLSLVNLFVFSTLHHGINASSKVNNLLRTFDYVSVFALIAGTVTPLVLVLYRNVMGWSVFGVVWVIAIFAIILRASNSNLPRYITNSFYIVLGWLPAVLVLAGVILPLGALLLLIAGGIIYSLGFIVYVMEKPNYKNNIFGFHELWHCLVIAGALCHYLLMYIYVLPYRS
jgi:hemolysin III